MKKKIDDLKTALKTQQTLRAKDLELNKEHHRLGINYTNLKNDYNALKDKQADYNKLKEFKDTYDDRIKQYHAELLAAIESEKREIGYKKKAENDYNVLFQDHHKLKDKH